MLTVSDLFRDFAQTAYVTDDIKRANTYLENRYGTVECSTAWNASMGGMVTVDGEPADEWVCHVTLVHAGQTQFEVFEPISGKVDLYRKGIRPGAVMTFHHLGYRIPDFDEATRLLHDAGYEWKQFGEIPNVIRFGYVDMIADVGHHVELMEFQQPMTDRFAELAAQSNVGRDWLT